MANEENLRPVRTHEEAVKRGRNGGLTKSRKRDIARSLSRRKYCTATCPIYPCMWQPLSKNFKEDNKFKCALNNQTPTLKKKFYNLCIGKEDEFINIMGEALTTITKPKELIQYGEKVFKMRFGNKNRTELRTEDPLIIQLQRAEQELDEDDSIKD